MDSLIGPDRYLECFRCFLRVEFIKLSVYIGKRTTIETSKLKSPQNIVYCAEIGILSFDILKGVH